MLCYCFFFLMIRLPPKSTRTVTLFPYTTLFRSVAHRGNRNLLGGRAQFVRIASPPDYQQGETVRIMHIHHIHVSAAWIAMFAYASVGLVSAAALISMSRRRRPPRWVRSSDRKSTRLNSSH